MDRRRERRLQPNHLLSAPPTPGGDVTRIRITRFNARVPMNRAEQRVLLLIWVCSICIALLTLFEICAAIYLAMP